MERVIESDLYRDFSHGVLRLCEKDLGAVAALPLRSLGQSDQVQFKGEIPSLCDGLFRHLRRL